MKSNGRDVVALIVSSIVIAVVSLIALVFFIGAHVTVRTVGSERAFVELSLSILVLGEFIMLVVFAAFVWIGVEDWHSHATISKLYRPQVAVKGFFFAYMTMLFAELIDLQLHDLKPHWAFLYTPVARLFQSVLLLGVFLSFLWVAVVILQGRATTRADAATAQPRGSSPKASVTEETIEVRRTTTQQEGDQPC